MSYVSLYQIVKEMEEEKEGEGAVSKSIEYSQKVSDYSKKFKQMMERVDIDISYFKKGEIYEFPVEGKPLVKKLLNLYTAPFVKRIKEKDLTNPSSQAMKEFIECLKELLTYKLTGKTLLHELNKLEALTNYSSKQAYAALQEGGVGIYMKNIHSLLRTIDEHMLSPDDRKVIVAYQEQEMQRVNDKMKKLVATMSFLREEELFENSVEPKENEKIEIHEEVAKELIKEKRKQKENEKNKEVQLFQDFTEWTGLVEELIEAEIEKLLEGEESEHFTLIIEEVEVPSVQSSEELLHQAIQKINKEKE